MNQNFYTYLILIVLVANTAFMYLMWADYQKLKCDIYRQVFKVQNYHCGIDWSFL